LTLVNNKLTGISTLPVSLLTIDKNVILNLTTKTTT